MARRRKLSAADKSQLERVMLVRLAELGKAVTLDQLADAKLACNAVTDYAQEEGMAATQVADLRAQAHEAYETAKHKLMNATPKKLDVVKLRPKVRNLANLMHHYTAAEFARECLRLARAADWDVLRENEFTDPPDTDD